MKHFFLKANVAMISEKLLFSFSMATIQNCAANQSKLFLEKWSRTDKEYSREVVIKVYPLHHC